MATIQTYFESLLSNGHLQRGRYLSDPTPVPFKDSTKTSSPPKLLYNPKKTLLSSANRGGEQSKELP